MSCDLEIANESARCWKKISSHKKMLDVTSYVRLHTMLHVGLLCIVRSCCTKFETDRTFSYAQTDATTSNNVGSCWPIMLRPFARGLIGPFIRVVFVLRKTCWYKWYNLHLIWDESYVTDAFYFSSYKWP